MKIKPVFLVLLLLITGTRLSSAAQQDGESSPLPMPPGGKVIRISPPGKLADEPSIAINPHDPQQLVAAYQVNATAAYSRDGGHTWTVAQGTAPSDYRVSGDVSVTFDNQGRAFLCYIAFDKLGTVNYWARGATRNGIFVRRSLDGGKTWEKNAAAVIAQKTEPGIPFEDKPYIVADNTHSRYAGNLYVGWTEFTLTKSVILFSRSTDGGLTWSKPVEISTHEGLPRDETGAVEGFSGAVGADGTLYVVWADGSEIVLTTSRNGGRSFTRSRSILKTAPSDFALDAVDRANGFPEIGIDPRSNRLFVAWSGYQNGDIDVFCSTSTDRGKHWTAAVRVNSDPLHNGADQFFQWLAVDPVDGSANLVFYDRRSDPANHKCVLALARSTDGGRSFTNYAWGGTLFDPAKAFIGDYTGIAAYGGHVYAIWGRELRPEEMKQISPQPAEPVTTEKKPSDSKSTQKTTPEEPEKSGEKVAQRAQVVEVGLADFPQAADAQPPN